MTKKIRTPHPLILALLTVMAGFFTGVVNAEVIYVVTHKDNPVDSITKTELRHIYLGKTHRLKNGISLVPVELSNSSAVKTRFHEIVTRKTLDQLSAHWARLLFTGRGHPIDKVSHERSVINYVSRNKMGIGYVSQIEDGQSVKVLLELKPKNNKK